MIKASRNQLGNIGNRFQGSTKKVLCVCSAGLLRSPTTANVLHQEFGYNTRACGAVKEYALIPISEALISWADQIVFVNMENYDDLDYEEIEAVGTKAIILDVPDKYDWNDETLRGIILEQYNEAVNGNEDEPV